MQESEERSQTERHWDILSMTILTRNHRGGVYHPTRKIHVMLSAQHDGGNP